MLYSEIYFIIENNCKLYKIRKIKTIKQSLYEYNPITNENMIKSFLKRIFFEKKKKISL